MIRLVSFTLVTAALAGCGDNNKASLVYKDPPPGGALRLVRDPSATGNAMVLDFVVGDQPLIGYSTGFDLPLDASKVAFGKMTPGTALDPGSAPAAVGATIPDQGPLAGVLVVGLSQKASGNGASASDATLAPGAQLFQLELDRSEPSAVGVVFDGLTDGFRLPSGGLRNKAGATVVDETKVSIGRLEVAP